MSMDYYVRAVRVRNLSGQPGPRIGASKYTRTYHTLGEAELQAEVWRQDVDWMVFVMNGHSPRG